MTASERRLWRYLRGGAMGARFRRQVPMGEWIVDFACFDPALVVEVDDESHDWRDETERTRFIERQGFRVVRFPNRDVARDLESVLGTIRNHLEDLRGDELVPPPGGR
jgi:very-short-patch-repair endonuclease